MIKACTRWLERCPLPPTFLKKVFGFYYNALCQKEAEASHITVDSNVLFIGAGSYPYSALYFAHRYQARVTAIDSDACAVARAQCHHCERFQVVCAEGATVDVRGYDVIVIAKQVVPQGRVLEHVLHHAEANTRIIVRNPHPPNIRQDRMINAIRHRGRFVKISWLYA